MVSLTLCGLLDGLLPGDEIIGDHSQLSELPTRFLLLLKEAPVWPHRVTVTPAIIRNRPPHAADCCRYRKYLKSEEHDRMLMVELCGKIDAVLNAFWPGGIANPMEVIEQITYLLFMRPRRGADARRGQGQPHRPIKRRIFPKWKAGLGKGEGVAYADMRCRG